MRDWAPSVYLVGFKLLSGASTPELIRQAEVSGRINRADLTVANDLQSLVAGSHTVHLIRTGHPPLTLEPGDDLADRLVERSAGVGSSQEAIRDCELKDLLSQPATRHSPLATHFFLPMCWSNQSAMMVMSLSRSGQPCDAPFLTTSLPSTPACFSLSRISSAC